MNEKSLPLVSIGIPALQGEKYLSESIRSALSQSYQNIEVIISDNGSTDKTSEIAAAFVKSDPRVRLITHPRNQGPTFNFTFVFKEAKGEFFFWLGDDDWIDPNYVEVCIAHLIRNPGLAACSGAPAYYINNKYSHNGASIEVLGDRPSVRIFKYLSQVADNAIFYGAIRRSWLCDAPFVNCMGWDWSMFSSLAYRGGLITDATVKVHRRLGGISSSYSRIATAMELPTWNSSFPYTAITLSIVREIISNPRAYPGLSGSRKIIYSIVVVIAMFRKYCRSIFWRLRDFLKAQF